MSVEDDAGARPGWALLGNRFADLSALLASAHSGPPDPERVVQVAARAVPHTEHSALTVVRGNQRPRTLVATGEVSVRVDAIQYATGQGPCLEAVEGSDVSRTDDLAADRQWPDFAGRCVAETGIRSMFSLRLVLADDARAALNFYAARPGAFEDLDIAVGAMFAPFAALAVQNELRQQEVQHLRSALVSSRQIGAAVGILMARRMLTYEQAFDQLTRASQHLNVKLRDIAAEVTHTGDLPDRARKGNASR